MSVVTPVRFKGRKLFWLREVDNTGALAPEHHVKDGKLDYGSALSTIMGLEDSFAHVFADGIIRRYNEEIGRVEDLEIIAQ